MSCSRRYDANWGREAGPQGWWPFHVRQPPIQITLPNMFNADVLATETFSSVTHLLEERCNTLSGPNKESLHQLMTLSAGYARRGPWG